MENLMNRNVVAKTKTCFLYACRLSPREPHLHRGSPSQGFVDFGYQELSAFFNVPILRIHNMACRHRQSSPTNAVVLSTDAKQLILRKPLDFGAALLVLCITE